MGKLDNLIKEKCPNGVKMYSLGELGIFYGGLTGKSKNDFVDGNAKFITYKNVYSNPALCLNVEDRVKIAEGEKQRTLEYGDIIFTGSSETPDECGLSSVFTSKTDEKIYLNSFCFFFRLNNPEILLPDFAKHLFRSNNLRYQIGKTASGVTRFNVSKERMKSVKIPIPPIEIQNEIVQILDNFAELTAELTAELSNRKKQYEYYRDLLLNFDKNGERERVRWLRLGDIATILRGGSLQKKDFVESGVPCIHYGQIYTRYGMKTNKTLTFINKDTALKQRFAETNDIVMAVTSENLEDVCKCVVWLGSEKAAVSGHTAIIKHEQDARYLAYYFGTSMFFDQKRKYAHGTKVIEVSPAKLADIVIPIPPIEVQREIADKLDRFSDLSSDISEGLPAEIEARQKQYVYYRDKLLTFEEAK